MKKSLKSLIASVLAMAMIFALAACGTSGTPGQSGLSGTPGKSGNEPAPAFVYVSSFREIDNAQGQGIGAACFTDKGFYTTPSEIVGQREPAEGEVAEYEGQFDIYEDRLYFVSFDGQRTKLENYEPVSFTPAEGHDGYGELNKLASDAQGNLAAVYHSWESWNEAPEGMSEDDPEYWNYYKYEENWFLRTMDPTGRTLGTAKIDLAEGDWFWPSSLVCADGKVLLAGSDGLRIFNASAWSIPTT